MVIIRKLTCVVTFIVSSMNSSVAGMKGVLCRPCLVRQSKQERGNDGLASGGGQRRWSAQTFARIEHCLS